MVVVLKYGIPLEDAQRIRGNILERYPNLKDAKLSVGREMTTIQLIGDERGIRSEDIEGIGGVERYMPVLKPYKLVSREFHPEDTIIRVGNVEIGKEFVVMAGPCSVEEDMVEIARMVKSAGGKVLRGGAFKPRTSPYADQGMGERGLELLGSAGQIAGMPVITEVMAIADIETVTKYADILQVGMRNATNYALLKELSQTRKPVLLKRGLSDAFDVWLQSAEYLYLGKENGDGEYRGGNPNVMLCERGIKSFDPDRFRNTLDINAVAEAKRESHLPVIVDSSHGTGKRHLVVPVGLASILAGADGLLVEAHPDPNMAKSDGAQTIDMNALEKLVRAGEELYRFRKEWQI
jgi:3-deoxy-7-phosphoheptulonate synthase